MADQVQAQLIETLTAVRGSFNQAVQQLTKAMSLVNTIMSEMIEAVNFLFTRGVDFPLALDCPLMAQLSEALKTIRGAGAVYKSAISLLNVRVAELLNEVDLLLEQQPLLNEGDLRMRRLQCVMGQLAESIHNSFQRFNTIVTELNTLNQSLTTTANPFVASHDVFFMALTLSSTSLVQATQSGSTALQLYTEARDMLSVANVIDEDTYL